MPGMPTFTRGHRTCARGFAVPHHCTKSLRTSLLSSKSRRDVKLQCAVPGELVNLYDILGVQPGASEKDIKLAFRRKALESHPDISKEAGAEVKFIQVRKAYDVLSCKARRQAYDRELQRWWATQRGYSAAFSSPSQQGTAASHAAQGWSRSYSASPSRAGASQHNSTASSDPSHPSSSGRPHATASHSSPQYSRHTHTSRSSSTADPRHRGSNMYSKYTYGSPYSSSSSSSSFSRAGTRGSNGAPAGRSPHGDASFTNRSQRSGASSASHATNSSTTSTSYFTSHSNEFASDNANRSSHASNATTFEGRLRREYDVRYNTGSLHSDRSASSTSSIGSQDESESRTSSTEEDGWASAMGDTSFKWFEQVLGWGSFFQEERKQQQRSVETEAEREWLHPGWATSHTPRDKQSASGSADPSYATGSTNSAFSKTTNQAMGWRERGGDRTTDWITNKAELRARLTIWDAIMDNEMETWKKNVANTTTILQAALSDFDAKMEEKMEQSDKEMTELQQTLLQHMGNLDEQLKGHEGNGSAGAATLPRNSKWYSLMQQWSQKLSTWIREHCTSMEQWYTDMSDKAASQDKALERHSSEMYRTAQRLQQLVEGWDESFDTEDAEVAELWDSRKERWSERIEEVMGSWFLQVGEYERAYQRRLERCQFYTQSWVRQATSAKAQWQSRMRMWNMKVVVA